jgi:hypothetical protein
MDSNFKYVKMNDSKTSVNNELFFDLVLLLNRNTGFHEVSDCVDIMRSCSLPCFIVRSFWDPQNVSVTSTRGKGVQGFSMRTRYKFILNT